MDMDRVQFLSSSEEINKNASEYWPLVLNIACKNNVRRIMRCSQIMGRDEADEMEASQIFYPCMQARLPSSWRFPWGGGRGGRDRELTERSVRTFSS